MKCIAVISVLATGLVWSVPVAGQEEPGLKEVQIAQLEVQRRLIVAMLDSMPERLYRDRATPAQRDFAEQILHAAGAVPGIVQRFVGGSGAPAVPDTSIVLNRRDAMKAYVNDAFEWTIAQLRDESEADRAEVVPFFGQEIPRWQVWSEIHQHTIWTLGQVVANFRKHGMAPPPFAFF